MANEVARNLYVFISYSHVFFGELPIQILYLIFSWAICLSMIES